MLGSLLCLSLFAPIPQTHFVNAMIADGSGRPPYRGELLVEGDTIVAVGRRVRAQAGATRIDAQGQTLAPGFIDSHSHADGRIDEDPSAASQVSQGITTAVVGQDGGLSGGFRAHMSAIVNVDPALNFAAFSGHNTIRGRILGSNFQRVATPREVRAMEALVEDDMKAGALGLSTGLEYNPGFYSATEEVIALAKIASRYKGSYISHMRSEDRQFFDAVVELIRISREAKLPAQVSHVKLALPMVWGQAGKAIDLLEKARREGLQVTADIYPYPYWQSTITVITNRRDWEKVEVWRDAIAETGGPDKILLSRYTAEPSWAGKTIAEIAALTKRPAEEIVHEIVQRTSAPDSPHSESVIVTAMSEDDMKRFIAWPHTSVCSDGSIGGSHPRGAGSFPRMFRRYVREDKVLSVAEMVRRMTSRPAEQFGFADRGRLRAGFRADLVLFDPATIGDRAVPLEPRRLSEGVSMVFVNGKCVWRNGAVTGERPGRVLVRGGGSFTPDPAVRGETLALHADHTCP